MKQISMGPALSVLRTAEMIPLAITTARQQKEVIYESENGSRQGTSAGDLKESH